MTSGEFKRGNLSCLLRDNSGSQFKSLTRGLNRADSGVQSKENLIDMSTTSNDIFSSKGIKHTQKNLNIMKTSREGLTTGLRSGSQSNTN